MKRFIFLGFAVGIFILYLFVRWDAKPEVTEVISQRENRRVERIDYQAAQPRAASWGDMKRKAASFSENEWISLANRELELRREEWGLAGYHDFVPEVSGDPLGRTVTYRVMQDGVPIADSFIQMRFANSGELESIDNRYQKLKYLKLNELASREETLENYASLGSFRRFQLTKKQESDSPVLMAGSNEEAQLVFSAQAVDTERNNQPVTVFLRAGDSELIRLMYPRQEIPKRYSHGR